MHKLAGQDDYEGDYEDDDYYSDQDDYQGGDDYGWGNQDFYFTDCLLVQV